MQLVELFKADTNLDFEETAGKSFWAGYAKLDSGRKLNVSCERQTGTEDSPIWNIVFSVDSSYGETGDGNEFEVFKKVVTMLEKFQKHYDVKTFTMSASGSSRISLYKRMLKRLLPGGDMLVYTTGKIAQIGFTSLPEYPVFFDDVAKITWTYLGDNPIGEIVDPNLEATYATPALSEITENMQNLGSVMRGVTEGMSHFESIQDRMNEWVGMINDDGE